MTLITRNILFKTASLVLLALSSMLCFGAQSIADNFTDRRISAGTKIFRALMAADSDIAEKKNRNNALGLCFVYSDDQRNAELSAEILYSRSDTDIRGIKITPEFVSVQEFVSLYKEDCAGIFLTEELSDKELAKIKEIASKNKRVLFSPFEGDVERGVMGGIKVESRVLPYVNFKAMRQSHITLKPFFMKIAKTYEE